MKKNILISLSSRLSQKANQWIVHALKQAGLHDIAPSHGDILAFLLDGKAYEMGEIARKIHRTKPTVTVLIEKLEKAGYVEKVKSQADARFTKVILSEKGMALKSTFQSISQALNERAYAGLSIEEAELLEMLLQRAIANFDHNQ